MPLHNLKVLGWCTVLQVGGELFASELQNVLLDFFVMIYLTGGVQMQFL
jgi:hypothetical protein